MLIKHLLTSVDNTINIHYLKALHYEELFYFIGSPSHITFVSHMTFVSLTSDFGTESQFPGICKLISLQTIPDAQIIDINHNVKRYSIVDTVYHFQAALNHFQAESVHFLLSNLYGHSNHRFLYVYENQQHIFAPDNGCLPLLFGEKSFELFELKGKPIDNLVPTVMSLLAETAKSILEGHRDEIQSIDAKNIVQEKELSSIFNPDEIVARVLHIDRFENIILNLRQTEFEEHRNERKFVIRFPNGDEILNLSNNYNDVKYLDKVAFFNASGLLEIAVNHSNAAGLFGFKPHNDMLNAYKNITIKFS